MSCQPQPYEDSAGQREIALDNQRGGAIPTSATQESVVRQAIRCADRQT